MNFESLILQLWGFALESGVLRAVLIFVASWIALRFFRNYVLHYMEEISKRTETDIDDLTTTILKRVPSSLYVLIALFVSLQFVSVSVFISDAVKYSVIVVAAYYVIKSSHILIDYVRDKIIERRLAEDEREDVSIIRLLARLVKYSLWLFGVLIVLANLDVDISALIAGLGIGGIAIALAAQNILDDIFSSFSIHFDKPFRVGDFILIGDDRGEVVKIGIKTTRIKTLRGEELVVSNKEMTTTRIHNFGRMPHRRIDFRLGVRYDTPVEKLNRIPQIVRDIIGSQKLVRFDRAHFKEFGDFSLNYEVVYYLDSSDYNMYMDTQQAINLAIKKAFESEGIEFAYPTQTIVLQR